MKYRCIKSFYTEEKDEYGLPIEILVNEGTIWNISGYSYSTIKGQLLSLITYPYMEITKIDNYTLNEHFEKF